MKRILSSVFSSRISFRISFLPYNVKTSQEVSGLKTVEGNEKEVTPIWDVSVWALPRALNMNNKYDWGCTESIYCIHPARVTPLAETVCPHWSRCSLKRSCLSFTQIPDPPYWSLSYQHLLRYPECLFLSLPPLNLFYIADSVISFRINKNTKSLFLFVFKVYLLPKETAHSFPSLPDSKLY